jgi:hypothetical protein
VTQSGGSAVNAIVISDSFSSFEDDAPSSVRGKRAYTPAAGNSTAGGGAYTPSVRNSASPTVPGPALSPA